MTSVARVPLHAYIDEAGDRSRNLTATRHFVMSAVLMNDGEPAAGRFLTELRGSLGRGPTDPLHWRNLKHSEKVHAAQRLGRQPWAVISSVVVCKRHLTGTPLNDDQTYLYTLRYLLERLSWYARDHGCGLSYTVAHIRRFHLSKLRQYEAVLRALPACQIAWGAVPKGGAIDQPNRIEQLQLADLAASATFNAFEPDKFGNTEGRYLRELAPRLYRRGRAPLTSYGLKIHPWTDAMKAAYPWVATL